MYYERQRGGLCRLHSLNAYFGYKKLSDQDFTIYKKEYDEYYSQKYNIQTSCTDYDLVNSDQTTIISFVLKKYGAYTKFFALNTLHGKPSTTITNILKGDFFFIYNPGHIWGIRKESGTNKWFTLDSMAGIRPININSISAMKNVGFIVPVNMKDELYRNLSVLKQEFKNQKPKDRLTQIYKEKKLMGDVEVPLNIILDIMQTNYRLIHEGNKHQFTLIEKNIELYTEFLKKYSKKRSLEIIIEYIPTIIESLLTISDRVNPENL